MSRRFFSFAYVLLCFFFSEKSLALDIYPVVRSDVGLAGRMMSNRCTAGVTFYTGWSKVEPIEHKFDFEGIQGVLKTAQAHGKKVNLAVLPGRWSPVWAFDGRGPAMKWMHKDAYVESGRAAASKSPLPWNAEFRKSFDEMIVALADAVAPYRSSINSVAITGGSNTNGIEMNFIGSDRDLRAADFDAKVYAQNWKQLVDLYAKNFVGVNLTLAVHTMYGSQRTSKISEDVLEYAKSKLKNNLQVAALAFTDDSWFSIGNEYADLVLSNREKFGAPVLQAIKIYSKDQSKSRYLSMIQRATEIRPAWLEVWAEDVRPGYFDCDAAK